MTKKLLFFFLSVLQFIAGATTCTVGVTLALTSEKIHPNSVVPVGVLMFSGGIVLMVLSVGYYLRDTFMVSMFSTEPEPPIQFAIATRSAGAERIKMERLKQIDKYGRVAEHDLKNNTEGELWQAAAALLCSDVHFPMSWDNEYCYNLQRKSRMEQLEIAGALIAAELDRLELKHSLTRN